MYTCKCQKCKKGHKWIVATVKEYHGMLALILYCEHCADTRIISLM